MQNQFLYELLENSIKDEVQRYLMTQDFNFYALAEKRAVKMLNKIVLILNDESLSPDDVINKILKVLVFIDNDL